MSKALERVKNKIFNKNNLLEKLEMWRGAKKKIVFTNGCFDLIHLGHIEVLARSADLGDILIIGVNTDSSIKELKGNNRPIIEEDSRAQQPASTNSNDASCCALESSSIIGLLFPLSSLIDESVFTPTISMSPRSADLAKTSI